MFNVSTLCLGLIAHGDWTGYDIKRAFEVGPFSHFFEASFGSIYPALAGLEADGLVTSRTETRDGRPNRKVYSITEAGQTAFETRLQGKTPQEDKFRSEFLVAMLFAAQLGTDRVADMVDAQIERLEQRLAGIDEQEAETIAEGEAPDAASRFVSNYGRHVLSASIEYLRAHRDEAVAAANVPAQGMPVHSTYSQSVSHNAVRAAGKARS